MIDESGMMTCLAAGKVIVTGLASSGTSAAANVTVQRNINEFTVTGIENKYHTGKAIKQKFSVTDGTVTLEETEENIITASARAKIKNITSGKKN